MFFPPTNVEFRQLIVNKMDRIMERWADEPSSS